MKVAEVFGKRHKDVLKAITASIQALRNFAPSKNAFVKSSYIDSTGKSNPLYYLNRDAFTFVVMGFTGKKAAQFKWAYIQEFNRMEAELKELLAMRKTSEWQEARNLSKFEFRNLTDFIKEKLLPRMQAEGASDAACRWVYKNYVNLIQGLLKIKKGGRDELPSLKLYELSKLEQITILQIEKGLAANKPAKEIYAEVKSYLQFYAQISMFQPLYLE